MAEGCGRQDHQENRVSSVGDRGEHRGARQGEREVNSEEWSVRSNKESYAEREEDRMPAGELEGSADTLTASPRGTQEIETGGLRVDAQAGGRDEWKAPAVTVDKAGTWGHHGVK